MKKLYSGFDLCAPSTSVSMTINGPAPIILAMFMNTAIDQQVEKYLRADQAAGMPRTTGSMSVRRQPRPSYSARCRDQRRPGPRPARRHRRSGGRAETYARIKADTLSTVRGTVQADILKEDQAQNTCIFSTEFALRMMGDIQQYFVDRKVRNFYSVSISGYHIAEAGANPISQLAFTLSNGFTIVEYYLARGMKIDDFAPNLSFFFSNGMDPEYTVIGRVARRIWARAMRERYGASERSQMMKYHIQTSGRSPARAGDPVQRHPHHAAGAVRVVRQLQQPAHQRLRRGHHHAHRGKRAPRGGDPDDHQQGTGPELLREPLAGQLHRRALTDLVEEAVYKEFEAISERGGVLGAMDTMYQRGKIQEESLYYEHKKHDGSLPLVGVNTFLPKEHAGDIATEIELIRSTEGEKGPADRQRAQLPAATQRWRRPRLASTWRMPMGARSRPTMVTGSGILQATARDRRNVFAALMDAVKTHSLGQISHALYDVGGEYRRNM
jgi:methylmalonyl-CoA mutase